MLPCIYCRSDTPHRTREHVLQAGFGGVATLPVEVCADCNAAFSAPDKDLIEHVDLFARRKASALSGLGFLEDVAAGVRLSVILRLESGGDIVRLLPQAYRDPGGIWRFVGADEVSLRRGLEGAYRQAATLAPDRAERVRLVDEANRVRARSLT